MARMIGRVRNPCEATRSPKIGVDTHGASGVYCSLPPFCVHTKRHPVFASLTRVPGEILYRFSNATRVYPILPLLSTIGVHLFSRRFPVSPPPIPPHSPHGGGRMFLSRSPLVEPGGPVQALLSLEEPQALQAAMNALEPEEVALAIGQASTLDEKSRLI